MFISLGIVFLQYWFGPSLVKRSMNVRPLSEAEAPHIHQMVEELAQTANIPKPQRAQIFIPKQQNLHTLRVLPVQPMLTDL